MVPIYTPKSESEASVIGALLDAYGVVYHMQGGAFSTMYPGPVSNSLNAQKLLVRADQVELALQLLQDFMDESD